MRLRSSRSTSNVVGVCEPSGERASSGLRASSGVGWRSSEGVRAMARRALAVRQVSRQGSCCRGFGAFPPGKASRIRSARCLGQSDRALWPRVGSVQFPLLIMVSWQAHESTSGRRLARHKARRVRRIPLNPPTGHFGMRELAARKTLEPRAAWEHTNACLAAIRIVNTGTSILLYIILNDSERIEVQPHRSGTQNR